MNPNLPFFLLFILCSVCGLAKEDVLVVESIRFEGLSHTKLRTAERELNIRVGDTIHQRNLTERLEANRLLLLNSSLFNEVTLNVTDWQQPSNRIGITATVVETHYFYPVPVAALVDRNFNVWWNDFDHSLRRVNFGGILYHTNLTGRRDNLKAMAQFGYSQRYQLRYRLPGINRAQTLGTEVELFYQRNREIGYATIDNELVFQRTDDRYLLRRFRGSAALTYRPGLRTYHSAGLQYRDFRVDDLVDEGLNDDFLLRGNRQQYLSLFYTLEADQTDVRPYPTAGYRFLGELRKDGLGLFDDVNSATVRGNFRYFLPISEKWSSELGVGAKYQFVREQQPYYLLSRALGYEDDYLRGYEYYVIDGQDYAYAKQTLRFRLLDKSVTYGKIMPLKSMRTMPYRIYLKGFADQGYVNNPYYSTGNNFSNRTLYGYGFGLDLVLYYNFVFQFEFSFNHTGESGLYLHTALAF